MISLLLQHQGADYTHAFLGFSMDLENHDMNGELNGDCPEANKLIEEMRFPLYGPIVYMKRDGTRLPFDD